MTRKREISAAAACKRLEILYATRLARADKLSSRYLLTASGPPLYWTPGKPCRETEAAAERQRAAHGEWKAAQLEALEIEKAALVEQMAARQAPRVGEESGGYGGEGGLVAAAEAAGELNGTEGAASREEGMEEAAGEQQEQQAAVEEEEEEQGGLEEDEVEELLQPPLLEGEEAEAAEGGSGGRGTPDAALDAGGRATPDAAGDGN